MSKLTSLSFLVQLLNVGGLHYLQNGALYSIYGMDLINNINQEKDWSNCRALGNSIFKHSMIRIEFLDREKFPSITER